MEKDSMTNGMKVRSDGNGGFDFWGNIQQSTLRRWGPVAVIVMGSIFTMANRVGEELMSMLFHKEAVDVKIEHLQQEVGQLRNDLGKVHAEVVGLETKIEEVRVGLSAINAVLQKPEKEGS